MNMIRPSYAGWGWSVVKATALSAFLLISFNLNVHAQGLPPLPGDGGTQPPREPTPEELEAQRKAQEAHWQKNLERFAPFAHKATPAPELDSITRNRLLSAEALVRDEKERVWQEHVRSVRAHSAAMREKQIESRERAIIEARKLGIVLAEDAPGGDIVDFYDGQLVALKSMNAVAAKSIAADKAHTNAPATGIPSGPLTGYGVAIGLWDFGKPLTNHQEFVVYGPRVLYRDDGDMLYVPNLDNESHATQMAGTIGASGLYAPAIGMAYETIISARNQRLDLTEMGEDSVDYDIRVSNHSYGATLGWEFEAGDWTWYGPTNYSTEDYRFGFYGDRADGTDDKVFTSKYLLPVFAAGNDGIDTGPPVLGLGLEPHYHFWQPWTGGTNRDYHFGDGVSSGGYNMINMYATAKNVMTVAAINDLPSGWTSAAAVSLAGISSFGGTADGRIKPDISANGYQLTTPVKLSGTNTDYYTTLATGTSSATASITGGLALLDQRVREFYGAGKRFLASTYKALIIMTANEAGPSPGPDYKFGWGVADINRAASLLTRDLTNYHNGYGEPFARLHPHIVEGVLTNGTTNVIHVNYTSGTAPLRVVLAWNDPAFHPTNSPVLNDTLPKLVNDLDVRITASGGGTPHAMPYVLDPSSRGNAAIWGDNILDNVEMISTNLASGVYEIHVSHKATLRTSNYYPQTTNQSYSLIIEGQQVYARPLLLDIARVSSTHMGVTWSAEVGKDYKLQYSTNMPPGLWVDAISAVTATNTVMSVTNVPFSSGENRFYRAVLD